MKYTFLASPVVILAAILCTACSREPAHHSDTETISGDTTQPSDFPVIVYLETRDHIITIKAGPREPLYTFKTKAGEVVALDLSEKELQATSPVLHELLKSTLAAADGDTLDPSAGIMLAD